MVLRCPVCRADNPGEGNCRRCRADLAMLWTLEARREQLLTGASRSLASGQAEEALRLGLDAHDLRRGPDSWHTLALAHLLARDFAPALDCFLKSKGL